MNSRVSRFGMAGRLLGPSAVFAIALAAAVVLASSPARASEQSLLGVRINSPAKAVLQKLGNPTRVVPGAPTSAPLSTGAPGGAAYGGFGAPGGVGPLPQMPMGGPPGMMRARGMGFGPGGMAMPGGQDNERGGMPGEFGAPAGGPPPGFVPPSYGPPPGFMPPGSVPGMAGYMMGGNPAAQTAANGQVTDQTFQGKEVTYIYDKPNGLTYAFLLSPAPNGRVIQITVAGYKSSARTSRGVVLGSTYAQVLAKYGFPEQQAVEGDTVFISYAHRAHVAFQLMHNKVVSIMVAYIQ